MINAINSSERKWRAIISPLDVNCSVRFQDRSLPKKACRLDANRAPRTLGQTGKLRRDAGPHMHRHRFGLICRASVLLGVGETGARCWCGAGTLHSPCLRDYNLSTTSSVQAEFKNVKRARTPEAPPMPEDHVSNHRKRRNRRPFLLRLLRPLPLRAMINALPSARSTLPTPSTPLP
jgi:hypothetical protein